MKAKKHPGDPSGRSPDAVSKDLNYESAPSSCTTYYHGDEYVVRHKKTDTYWRCVYAVSDGSSDRDVSTGWSQVIKIERTVVDYKAV